MRWTRLPEFDAVPSGWRLAPMLCEVEFVFGQSPDSAHYNERGEGIPFLQGNADFTDYHPVTRIYTTVAGKKCEPGDTLISIRAPVGELCRADKAYALGRGVAALRPVAMDSGFFNYAMNRWRRPLLRAAQGTTFDAVTGRQVAQLRCMVPPPEEQTRIAETLKAADDHIRALADQLRTAERVKQGLVRQGTTVGLEANPNVRSIVRYRHSFSVNAGWDLAELRSLKPQIEYGTNELSNDHRAGVPVIAIPQVLVSRFALSELPHAEVSAQEKESLALRPHDVLLVRTNGNPSYIGRSTVIPERVLDTLTVFASYLIRIRVDQRRVRGAFLNYVLQSATGRRQSNCLANTSAGNFNLGARSLGKFLIPLPEPREQDEIVEAIDSADDLVLNLQKQLTAARRVKQSLLQNLLTGRIRLKP